MSETVLTLSGIGVVPLSGRGITERLTPLGNGDLRRTINGTLVDVTLTSHRKFQVSLSGGDVQPPALNGVWRGQATTVQCITELSKAITLTSAAAADVLLDRKPVTGSGRAICRLANYEPVIATSVTFETTGGLHYADVAFPTGTTGAAFVIYRPELSCLVDNWNEDTDEYAAAPGWTLELQEV
jgi:hypothetical protein